MSPLVLEGIGPRSSDDLHIGADGVQDAHLFHLFDDGQANFIQEGLTTYK